MIDIAHVLLLLPEVVQSRAPGAPRLPPDDVDTRDAGAVDLEPHLDADLGQVVPEEHGRVYAGALDRHDNAREGLRAGGADLQHVARADRVLGRLGEEGRPGTRAVQPANLLRVVGLEGGAVGRPRRGDARVHCEGGADW